MLIQYNSTANKIDTLIDGENYTVKGAIGIMPEFTYKRFCIQFKLDICVVVETEKPKDNKNGADSRYKRVSFKFPSNELILAVIIHFSTF